MLRFATFCGANVCTINCIIHAKHKKSMVNIGLYLDVRRPKKDGSCPIKISVSHRRQVRYIGTGLQVVPSMWDAKNKMVSEKRINHRLINSRLKYMIALAEKTALLIEEGKENCDSVADYRLAIEQALFGTQCKKKKTSDFIDTYNRFMNTKSGKTHAAYLYTLSRLKLYVKNWESLTFGSINRSWLMNFDDWLIKQGASPNTRGIHFRNIRAVFNLAIDDEITTAYPFRKFKIPKEETEKRSLTVEQLRLLFNAEVEDWQEKYRDYFKLTFFLIGMNAVDLLGASPDNISNGRLDFRRSKTGALFSIKIEDEAMKIINKYAGERHLINEVENYSDYSEYLRHINKGLQSIGPMRREGRGGKKKRTPLFPKLTTYWARHTWATIAADLDIPDATISLALGHAGENRTTDIYIRRNLKKVDEANRKVIDWVLYGKR